MFEPTPYAKLNSRQKENYNFHKVAAALADFGYTSIRLSDDFNGADFIALHIDGKKLLRVQLKGRLTFHKKYYQKGLHIAFRVGKHIYVYDHDELRKRFKDAGFVPESSPPAWLVDGSRSWTNIPAKMQSILDDYKLETVE